jgi:hypothetical protein
MENEKYVRVSLSTDIDQEYIITEENYALYQTLGYDRIKKSKFLEENHVIKISKFHDDDSNGFTSVYDFEIQKFE